MWADRILHSAMVEQALARGLTDPAELADLSQAWRAWSRQDDGWFVILHGEILARVTRRRRRRRTRQSADVRRACEVLLASRPMPPADTNPRVVPRPIGRDGEGARPLWLD